MAWTATSLSVTQSEGSVTDEFPNLRTKISQIKYKKTNAKLYPENNKVCQKPYRLANNGIDSNPRLLTCFSPPA